MNKPDLSAVFDLPPEQAIAYFKAKGYAITWDWRELWQESHAKAFTVAKIMRTDILEDIRGALDGALNNGTTLRDFQKSLTPVLQAKGWWGKTEHVNTLTGEVSTAQLGSPRRLQTIYQTNLQTAYMSRRYRELKGSVDTHPYWKYVAILDGRTRPTHRAMNGKVFHHDDAFWDTHFPPNGFNCRCRVQPLTAAAIKRQGITVASSAGRMVDHEIPMSDGSKVKVKALRIKVDGKDKLFHPDAGWSYNPGKAWSQWDKNGRLPDCGGGVSFAEGGGCIPFAPKQKTYKDYGRPDIRDVRGDLLSPSPTILPAAPTRAAALTVLSNALGVSDSAPLRVIQTPVEKVAIHHSMLSHVVEKTSDVRERYANFILPTLQDPYEVWLSAYADGYRRRYIGVFEDRNMLVIVRINQDGGLFYNTMPSKSAYMDKQRTGALMFGR